MIYFFQIKKKNTLEAGRYTAPHVSYIALVQLRVW